MKFKVFGHHVRRSAAAQNVVREIVCEKNFHYFLSVRVLFLTGSEKMASSKGITYCGKVKMLKKKTEIEHKLDLNSVPKSKRTCQYKDLNVAMLITFKE